MGDDMYDISKYTDDELYGILDINNPTDRELEAKILSLVYKYNNIGNESSAKLTKFFVDIYNHFFEDEESTHEPTVEGFAPINGNTSSVSVSFPGNTSFTGNTAISSTVNESPSNIQLTKQLAYSKDKLNPILTQTIKRIISIDSQYRDNKLQTPTTNFNFNLSEPLKDVVSLKLYSVQIPYNWYTVNSTFGGNFFYLKGNSPGINNENFYYQISINSGNYTPENLVSSINYDISTNLIPQHMDVSFGTTQLYYNTSTGLVTFDIDITSVFGESNYYLKFPDWSSITDITGQNNRFNTLAAYMGFNKTEYSCSSTDSNTIYAVSTDTAPTQFSLLNFDASSFTFYVYPYIGNGYPLKSNINSTSVVYNPIEVTIPYNVSSFVTRNEFIAMVSNTLKSNTYFDPNHSELKWIDLTTDGQYPKNYSYLNLSIKVYPNTQITPIIPNLKYAVVFPDASNSIFYGTTSICQFPTTYRDPSNNVVCELNNLIADAPILQSNYDLSGKNQMVFSCDASGYDNSLNTIIVDVPPFNNYILTQYISSIQNAIETSNKSSIIQGTKISQDVSMNINIDIFINQTFTNANYRVKATGKIAQIFGMTADTYYTLSNPTTDISKNYILNPVTLTSLDTLKIYPDQSSNNAYAAPFIIDFANSTRYNSIETIIFDLNDKLVKYTDSVLNTRPFEFSSIYYDYLNSRFVLSLTIIQNLSLTTYNLNLIGNDPSYNSWVNKLGFNEYYNIQSLNLTTPYAKITSNIPIPDQQIIFTNLSTNNYFELIPYSDIIGLQTSVNDYGIDYKVKITIPPKKYSMLGLLQAINNKLDVEPLAKGSKFEIVSIDGQNYVQFRANINKVFSTSDYQLSFYDPTSFVRCYSGATRIGNNSIQNVTWDTTIGWLLGYRTGTLYNLRDYVNLNKNSSINIKSYYLTGSKSNVCEMISDTSVNTNLYNYFLILLDDYAQNHLNDGLVTITNQETRVSHAPVKYICDPVTNQQIAYPADYGERQYTAAQLYSFNEQIMSQQVIQKSYSSGPFVKDVFGIIPLKVSGMSLGSVYVEFGGTLQNQERVYFGPVNISRMSIKLLTDRGDIVDLNNSNWSFSLVCEQLYKSS
jgi:hypothetical protein